MSSTEKSSEDKLPRQGFQGRRLRAFVDWLHVQNLFKCRLCWKIAFAVMVSIIAIAAAILIPSYQAHKSELMDKLHASGRAAVITGFKLHGHGDRHDFLLAGNLLVKEGLLKGGSLYRPDGSLIGHFGEIPHLTPALAARDKIMSFHQADGQRMDLIWPMDHTGLPFTVVGRLDATMIADEITAYGMRVTGLVLIVSLFVCLATMFALGKIILVPLLQLRTRLAEAGDDPANPENYTLSLERRDEFGDVVDRF
ncbi:MAG: hypothetical protein V3T02_10250, partial [Alphaproteobacteria bacterium]